jgi:hypothetical protein
MSLSVKIDARTSPRQRLRVKIDAMWVQRPTIVRFGAARRVKIDAHSSSSLLDVCAVDGKRVPRRRSACANSVAKSCRRRRACCGACSSAEYASIVIKLRKLLWHLACILDGAPTSH